MGKHSHRLSRRNLLKVGAGAAAVMAIGLPRAKAASFRNEELIYMPATALLELFRARKLSPVEVLKAQIDHAEKVEPKINAFSFEYFDEALVAAKESERRYMKGNARSLEGITLAIKDEQDIEGKITTNGSLLRQNDVAKSNHPIVQRIMDAGAVIHARTTTPEFSMAWVTWSKIWGVTRNPWNLYYSVGGSSGGAGATLAAGTSTLALGSDIGGSIRIPASVNGVYGFFAPFGRNPSGLDGVLIPYAADGPMARTFEDMVLFQNIISGPHPSAMESLRPKLVYPRRYESIKGLRIAYDMDFGYKIVDRDVKKNTMTALKLLERQGAIVEPVSLGWNGEMIKEAWIKGVLGGAAGGGLINLAKRGRDKMTDYARSIVEMAEKLGPLDQYEAAVLTGELYPKLSAIFEQGYKVLIAPTLASINERADFDKTKHTPIIEGKEVDPLLGPVMTYPFNVLNRNPIVNVPTGRARNNVPTGMQIIANTFDDLSAFQVAAAYSNAAPLLFSRDAFPDYRSEKV